jgi:hypothetical protein
MKRTPMPRRSEPMKRRAPVKRENRKRAGQRKAKAFGPQAALCRTLPCCVCGFFAGRSDPHHEPPRSRGGLDADCVPLCRHHHDRRHQDGPLRFWQRAGVHWRAVRDDMRRRVAEALPPSPTRPRITAA